MSQINLLPWREAQQKRSQQQFMKWLLISFIVGILLALLLFVLQKHRLKLVQIQLAQLTPQVQRLEAQQSHLEQLKNDIQRVEQKGLIFSQLRLLRSVVPSLFLHIESIIPESVYLHDISKVDHTLQIVGITPEYANIARFMDSLDGITGIRQVELQDVAKSELEDLLSFKFTLIMMMHNEEK